MKTFSLCIALLWITVIHCFEECNFNFMPLPRLCNISQTRSPVLVNPCNLIFDFKGVIHLSEPIEEVIMQYSKTVYKCKEHSFKIFYNQNNTTANYLNPYIVKITIADSTVRSVFTTEEQAYTMNISKTETNITAETYVAFLRAFQTFSQAFNCSRSRLHTSCALTNLPIFIEDKPQYVFRGLMIDPARHYIPMNLILQTIDTLMYSKLNVLHIHFTDQDSFPILLDKHPEIAQYAAFSQQEVYTIPDLKELVRYAMVRGVRVIPQIDTPGHAVTWSFAPQNKDVACLDVGKSLFRGPLDITLDATYDLVRDVLEEMVEVFVDPIIHLGGDQLLLVCLKNISYFQNMTNEQLLVMYRRRQKKILYELDPNKKPMFWVRQEKDDTYFPLQDDQIIHWWSFQQKPLPLLFPNNKYVMSYYGKHYLNMGTGNNKAVSYWNFSTWYDVYGMDIGRQHQDYPHKQNILGAQMTLWGQVSNKYTHHLKIWVKNAAFAEKMWNPDVTNVIPGVMKRMIAFQRLLNKRGIITSPITTRMCEQHIERCVDIL